jgi:assimilatory nitrate reductase electron transfer subunit
VAGDSRPDSIVTHDETWARRHRIDLRIGRTVTRISAQMIALDDDTELRYDELVLALGSRARLPRLDGLSTQDDRIAVLRTIEDCRRIERIATTSEHVAVLGGGVLGLEIAHGLARRGIRVSIVHPAGHLMDRQLNPEAGTVLGEILARQGIRLHTAKRARRWEHTGLRLTDGELLACDAVVVATGAAPESALAESAGIAVNNGIVIDDRLRTSHSGIYAIGDCARHSGAPGGFVQPGWEQAAVLADLLTRTNPAARYRGTPCVTRLKATGIELATMGDRDGPNDAEVLTFADSTRGRYARLTLNADRIVGAIMLGLPDAAATITQLFDRGAPAPSDRLALLLGRALPPESPPVSAPFRLPAQAVICRCNTVTKRQLITAWQAGARDLDALATATRATTGCGTCRDAVCGIQEWLASTDPADEIERIA